MHTSLENIPDRILQVAEGALTQANQHAVYFDPGLEHWDHMAVINAAFAGELFLKAIIAKEHPLLIFRDLFHLDDPDSHDLDIEKIIEKGRTYNFEHLPKLLWVTTGERLPDIESFEKLRQVRNSIQHFCAPSGISFQRLALEFIYNNIDPLIKRHFDINAVEHHEDLSVGYDYVVSCLVRHELLFSVPDNFDVPEIDLEAELSQTSESYQTEIRHRIQQKLAAAT
ncbi:MAG: hypothetical protein ABJQ08_17035 [Paracoccaceae bacterium]